MPSRFRASLVVALLGAQAFAVQPQFLRLSAMRDFMDGEIEGLAVDSTGRLSLAPAVTAGPDLGSPAVWAVVVDAQGVLYAATGTSTASRT